MIERSRYEDKDGVVHIVRGVVTDTDAHENCDFGDPEWQFSDGPPSKRSTSADFTSLERGLAEFGNGLYCIHL